MANAYAKTCEGCAHDGNPCQQVPCAECVRVWKSSGTRDNFISVDLMRLRTEESHRRAAAECAAFLARRGYSTPSEYFAAKGVPAIVLP